MSFPAPLPHGPLTRVTDGVYAVRSGFRMGPGVVISRTMTVVQGDDGLVIFNAARLSEAGEAELARLGPVKHLVKLSDSHGIDEPYYVDRFRPEVWVPEGSQVQGCASPRVLASGAPLRGSVVVDYPGTQGFRERGYLVPNGGGTLITCDALQNHVDLEGTTLLARLVTPVLGFTGGLIVAPMWRKVQKVKGDAVRRAFEPTLALRFENLVTGHGPAIAGGADAQVRAAVERAST